MPEEAAEEVGTDGELVEVEGESGELAAPTHDPFTFKILSVVQGQQSQNGLRHNDHLRYRRYCSRRLRRLYNVLRFKHGRGRFKQAPFPADFQDARFLEVPLVNAERAWSYGVQLKADNATASTMNPQWRHHAIARFAKAVKWGHMLETVCKRHADQRTQLEAEAYSNLLEGTWLLEKEEWTEALTKLKKCRRVCEHLGLASEQAESVLYKQRVAELAPMIRECRYNLGMGYDEEDTDSNEIRPSTKKSKDLSELSYRGHGLAIPSDKIKSKLMKCLQMVSAIKVGGDEGSGEVMEKYGELTGEFSDVLKDIHSDMIAAGADGATAEWRMLEAFARELSMCMNVERNMVLLWNHIAKLDAMQEVSSQESRRNYRPDEGMRFCELLKEDIKNLTELPDTTDSISRTLQAYLAVILNYRCLFLALCHCSLGKCLEAAALLDMLHARVTDVELSEDQPDPLKRLHALFERVQRGIGSRVGKWRCRVLAQICAEATKEVNQKEAEECTGESGGQAPLEEFSSLAAFPPKFRDVPCKPLLLDLAFQCIEAPDLDELVPKSGDKKGPSKLASMASGLGSRLGGLFNRGQK